jgi:hypothetical protein
MVKVSFFLPTSSRAWSRISMLREPPGMLRMAFAASAKAATEEFDGHVIASASPERMLASMSSAAGERKLSPSRTHFQIV